MWKAEKYFIVEFVKASNPKHHLRFTYWTYSAYRIAVCRLATLLGDVLSAGRRRSWIGDRIWSRNKAGFRVYCKIKDLLLFGIIHKGVSTWHTGEVFKH